MKSNLKCLGFLLWLDHLREYDQFHFLYCRLSIAKFISDLFSPPKEGTRYF